MSRSLDSGGSGSGTADSSVLSSAAQNRSLASSAKSAVEQQTQETSQKTAPSAAAQSASTATQTTAGTGLKGVNAGNLLYKITGESSVNQTRTRWNVGGTDLGIPVVMGNKLFLFIGDTFSGTATENMKDGWRSNVAAIVNDYAKLDLNSALRFDSMISDASGSARELISSKKIDNDEMTCIPTGGFSLNETLFLSYMSVRHWGDDGVWTVNYNSFVQSSDGGATWTRINSMTWTDGRFQQIACALQGDTIYMVGIPGGRNGNASLMKVSVSTFTDKSTYQYYTGRNTDGSANWQTGDAGLTNAAYLFDGLPGNAAQAYVGEPSLMYSDYLGQWLMTYLSGSKIVIRSAANVWGPWSSAYTIVSQKANFPDTSGIYGGFISPAMSSEGGKKLYMTISFWDPIYNVGIVPFELLK